RRFDVVRAFDALEVDPDFVSLAVLEGQLRCEPRGHGLELALPLDDAIHLMWRHTHCMLRLGQRGEDVLTLELEINVAARIAEAPRDALAFSLFQRRLGPGFLDVAGEIISRRRFVEHHGAKPLFAGFEGRLLAL